MQRSTVIILILGIIVVGGILFAATRMSSNATTSSTSDSGDVNSATNSATTKEESTVEPSSDLKTEDVKVGDGAEAVAGKSVTVHYVGTFPDGSKFDSSRDRGTPFTFTLGVGNVIAGWDQGVAGMKVGGVRKLTVPPSLGYGPNDYGSIPGNSTLLFEVELLKVD